ncbi:hypothetical protein [Mangrovactinospora gilvigrisea]|uniref:hypothetical protein n=1 Tax=Mangrovactinospora gilvigrisea TaxID=1428644 RepID=UPI001114FC4B|nr:hypothetical protein [Mangrovactinospora gilvigrisea]
MPDADTPQQQILEASVLKALARPVAAGLPRLRSSGTAFGLEGVTPDIDTLLLRPAGDLVAAVLARVLPCRSGTEVVGVPGLRAHISRAGLAVGRIGESATIEVQPSRTRSRTAAQDNLDEAAALTEAAGLTPLWTSAEPADGESATWHRLDSADAAVWSTALRRIGLFITAVPDWTRHAPTPADLAGPRPERIRPRPVGPGHRVTGVVAIVPGTGKGGLGCTTVAAALAGALARTGAKVGILAEQDDPNNILTYGRRSPAPAADGWVDLATLGGGGAVRARAISGDADVGQEVARARTLVDVVILDGGRGLVPQRHWPDHADAVLALMPHDRALWAGTRLVDRRPADIRMFAWLQERLKRFTRAGQRTVEPLEKMLGFLDEGFVLYVLNRQNDDDPAVYDASDPEDLQEWWEDYDFMDGLEPVEEDDFALPAEDRAPHLDEWRADYLAFLAEEGERRHGVLWRQATTQWALRNKIRNLAGLGVGERDAAEVMEEFAEAVEEEAIATWGGDSWRVNWPVWIAAREAGDDLLAPWAHLLEIVEVVPAPQQIADQLHSQVRDLPGSPTIITVMGRAGRPIGASQLAGVRDALMDQGYGGLVVLPHLTDLADLPYHIERVAQRAGEAPGAANRLADVLTRVLPTA